MLIVIAILLYGKKSKLFPNSVKFCAVKKNTIVTVILFKLFSAPKHVFHTDIFYTSSKIGMYGLLYILTYSLFKMLNLFCSEHVMLELLDLDLLTIYLCFAF